MGTKETSKMKISVADIRKFSPCYDPTEISGITENTEMTLLEWLQYSAKKLTYDNKIWLASKFMLEKQCRVFAIWCARQCETRVREIVEYIDVIERHYIFGTATKEELQAADSAARKVVDVESCYEPDRIAYDAAHDAADSAADWAAYEAAGWAAGWAAYYRDYRAAKRRQVSFLLEMLMEEESVCPSNLQAV